MPTLIGDKRRIADKSNDPYVKLQRESAKILGNAFYGKQIQNKEGRLKTYLVQDHENIEKYLHEILVSLMKTPMEKKMFCLPLLQLMVYIKLVYWLT